MKKIFYVHSHITYIVSKLIIIKNSYDIDDIVFFKARGYENKELKKYRLVDFTDIHDKITEIYLSDFYKIYSFQQEIDKRIDSISLNQKFILYLPIVRHKMMQIMATNKNCKGVNIIEEGINSCSKNFISTKEKRLLFRFVKFFVNNFFRVIGNRFFYIKPFEIDWVNKKDFDSTFYTLSPLGFKGIKYKVEVLDPLLKYNKKHDYSNENIIVFEAAVEQKNLKFETLELAFEIMLDDIKIKNVIIKYHPVQSKNNISKIEALLLKKGFTYKILKNDISVEELALSSSNLNVYGFTSSLLYYCHLFGSNVKSYEYLFNNDNLFKKFRKENDYNLVEILNS